MVQGFRMNTAAKLYRNKYEICLSLVINFTLFINFVKVYLALLTLSFTFDYYKLKIKKGMLGIKFLIV